MEKRAEEKRLTDTHRRPESHDLMKQNLIAPSESHQGQGRGRTSHLCCYASHLPQLLLIYGDLQHSGTLAGTLQWALHCIDLPQ
jgi:hypothetical protein